MSKIVEAVNAMVKNSSLIKDVALFTEQIDQYVKISTYYFKYKSYIWSIEDLSSYNQSGGYDLIFYPGFSSVADVIKYTEDKGMTEENYVKYESSAIKTVEADESFSELYRIVKGKLHDVDKVLDDIIADM